MKKFVSVALLSLALFGTSVAKDKACCASKAEANNQKACCAKADKSAKAGKSCCKSKVAVEYCKGPKCGWFAEARKDTCGTCQAKVSKL